MIFGCFSSTVIFPGWVNEAHDLSFDCVSISYSPLFGPAGQSELGLLQHELEGSEQHYEASSGSSGVGSGRVSFSLLSLGFWGLTSQLGRCAVQLCHVKAGVPAGRLYLCGHQWLRLQPVCWCCWSSHAGLRKSSPCCVTAHPLQILFQLRSLLQSCCVLQLRFLQTLQRELQAAGPAGWVQVVDMPVCTLLGS